MGLDFSIERVTNKCEHCGRADREDLFDMGNNLLLEGMTERIEKDGKVILQYGGTTSFKIFAQHIENGRKYSGEEAIRVIAAVKEAIRPEYYKKIMSLLKRPNTEFYAWW